MLAPSWQLTSLLLLVAVSSGGCGSAGVLTPPQFDGVKGSKLTNNAAKPQLPGIALSETEAMHQASLDAAKDSAASDVRYFSIAHVQATQTDKGNAEVVRKAVAKLINSLSSTNRPVAPLAVDAGGSLLKIHLRDYGWDAQRWELLAQHHPEADAVNIVGLADLKARTGTRKPVLRAEWFVANASRPPLYYQLSGLPLTVAGLQSILQVNFSADIANGQVIRAGFDNSKVSSNDRVIERHASPYGVVWQSYEFGTKTGNQDIFKAPLGPGGSKTSSSNILGSLFGSGGSANAFAADGNELVFNLPNGLLGFYIANAAGKRLDEVPGTLKGPPVTPGATCMSCHAMGFVPASDQVRAAVAKGALGADAVAAVNRLYVEAGAFNQQLNADAARFRKSLQVLGIDPVADGDPVSLAAAMTFPE